MSSELTNKDYTNILNFYKLKIPKSKRLLKMNAEKIINEKLCKCIKKVEPQNESKAIGICTKTIFGRKGFTRGKFKCTKKQFVNFRKTNKNKTIRKK
jgi:hypothetical protein